MKVNFSAVLFRCPVAQIQNHLVRSHQGLWGFEWEPAAVVAVALMAIAIASVTVVVTAIATEAGSPFSSHYSSLVLQYSSGRITVSPLPLATHRPAFPLDPCCCFHSSAICPSIYPRRLHLPQTAAAAAVVVLLAAEAWYYPAKMRPIQCESCQTNVPELLRTCAAFLPVRAGRWPGVLLV